MTAPAVASSVNLRVLLEEMIERDASDLHVTAGEKPKMRIDGEIQSSRLEFVMTPKDTMQLAYSVLTENATLLAKCRRQVINIVLSVILWHRVARWS